MIGAVSAGSRLANAAGATAAAPTAAAPTPAIIRNPRRLESLISSPFMWSRLSCSSSGDSEPQPGRMPLAAIFLEKMAAGVDSVDGLGAQLKEQTAAGSSDLHPECGSTMASRTASVERLGPPQSLPSPTMALTASFAMNVVLLARLRADS